MDMRFDTTEGWRGKFEQGVRVWRLGVTCGECWGMVRDVSTDTGSPGLSRTEFREP